MSTIMARDIPALLQHYKDADVRLQALADTGRDRYESLKSQLQGLSASLNCFTHDVKAWQQQQMELLLRQEQPVSAATPAKETALSLLTNLVLMLPHQQRQVTTGSGKFSKVLTCCNSGQAPRGSDVMGAKGNGAVTTAAGGDLLDAAAVHFQQRSKLAAVQGGAGQLLLGQPFQTNASGHQSSTCPNSASAPRAAAEAAPTLLAARAGNCQIKQLSGQAAAISCTKTMKAAKRNRSGEDLEVAAGAVVCIDKTLPPASDAGGSGRPRGSNYNQGVADAKLCWPGESAAVVGDTQLHTRVIMDNKTMGKKPDDRPPAAPLFSEMDTDSLDSIWGVHQGNNRQQEQQQKVMDVDEEEIAQVVAAHLARHRNKRRRVLMQSSSKQQ
eukprot:gene11059-11214_t